MGRELKRVSLDFDWPLKERWKGYLNPFYEKCPDCERGQTEARDLLERFTRLMMLAGEDAANPDRNGIWPHPFLKETPYLQITNAVPREFSEVTTGLAEKEPGVLGYCGLASWSAQKKILKAAGLDEDWGICATCGGECIHPDFKEQYENWEKEEPPPGDGFQLWETTSEGSPITPVFKTLQELCIYASENCSTFADNKISAEQWFEMLSDGFVYHKEGNAIFV